MDINQSANTQKPIGRPFSQSFLGNQPMATNSRHGLPQLLDSLDSLDSILQNSTSTSSEKSPAGSARVQEADDGFMQPELLHGTGQGSLQSSRAFGVQMAPRSRRYPYTQQTHESIPSNCELSVCNDDDTSPRDDATESSEHGDECGSTLETVSTHPKGLGLNESRTGQSDVKMRDVEPEQSSPAIRSSSDTISVNLLGLHKDPERVLEYLKTLPKELLKSALNEDAENSKATGSTQDSANQKTQYPCTECPKKFARPCELKFVTRRESFKHHLSKDHMMKDAKQIEKKLDKCRIGRHCDTRFWCGFCVEIVEITDEGVNAWTKRCDHIDDHFSGRDGKPKRNIIEWKQMETENQRRDASTQSSTEESSSTSDSGMSSPLKRKLSADAEIVSRKKQRQDVVYMWQCCCCNADINLKTTTMCIECGHRKCQQDCVVSKIFHRPDS
ncbi:hypothetical protein QQX98_005910 [Neonectria punicea]|uniref:C2H2-type domain-containing protein n=1 Tax=Neonectria punicea TaxID=979145 RepID=A0ABR1H2V0_9HYPO